MDIEELSSRRARREKKRRMKRVIGIALLVLIIAAVVIGLKSCGRVERDGSIVTIEITQGSSARSIANTLKENKLISGVSGFLNDLKKSEYSDKLRYGVFEIERGASNDEIIKLLASGGSMSNSVKITIPEGFSLERIVERIADTGLCSAQELYSALKDNYDYAFLNGIPDSKDIKYGLQGFLFPSTYEFTKDATAHDVINAMLAEFGKQIEKNKIPQTDLFRTITLASLVEREAKLDDERARIAGVIENRIAANMRLQIDATVVYAISDGMYNVDRVLYKDLEVDSPYNTYANSGLPAGPICSPGIKSIIAASKPDKHKYLYYRTDTNANDGSHIFTENFDEHRQAAN